MLQVIFTNYLAPLTAWDAMLSKESVLITSNVYEKEFGCLEILEMLRNGN